MYKYTSLTLLIINHLYLSRIMFSGFRRCCFDCLFLTIYDGLQVIEVAFYVTFHLLQCCNCQEMKLIVKSTDITH